MKHNVSREYQGKGTLIVFTSFKGYCKSSLIRPVIKNKELSSFYTSLFHWIMFIVHAESTVSYSWLIHILLGNLLVSRKWLVIQMVGVGVWKVRIGPTFLKLVGVSFPTNHAIIVIIHSATFLTEKLFSTNFPKKNLWIYSWKKICWNINYSRQMRHFWT